MGDWLALTDLGKAEFDFFVKKASVMRNVHEEEFVKRIDPDLLRAQYRGKARKDPYNANKDDDYDVTRDLLAFSRLFQASNTILPNVYYQNPAPIVIPGRNADSNSSALMTSIIKHYMKLNDAKRQNQEAVMNAWFFGIGWKKLGYRTVFMPRVDEPESQVDPSLFDKLRGAAQSIFGKPDNTESKMRPDLVDYETLFNDSESPMNIMLDDKADLMNCKVILHRIPRTLYDLQNYGDYDPATLQEAEEKIKNKYGTRFDSRETELWMNEMHIQQRNGIWILTWLEDFEKPLRYEKSSFQGKGFLFSPLIFTFEPGIRYPVSHMKVASQVQIKLDKLANMYVELIARSANFICVNEKSLSPGQSAALEKNLIRGLLKFKNPITPGDITNFQSGQVPADVERLMSMLQANITEIMGADEQMVGGKSKNETLGQDELARMGTKIRESGMQDRVRDWMIDQFRKESVLIKQYSNAQLDLLITGEDYSDPTTGVLQEDKWVSFMTPENPLGAKHYLQGEFDIDINIYEAIKPNKQVQQQQYERMMLALPNVEQMLLQDGVKVKSGLIAKEWFKTFEGLGNPDRFLEQLDPMQVAAIRTQKLLEAGGMMGSQQPAPKEPPRDQTKSVSGVSQTSSAQSETI